MLAMPTASDGAPPVRANSVVSPISLRERCICSAVTGKPQLVIVATAASAVAPTTPGPLLIAKYTPGSSSVAAIIAMMRDARLQHHAAVADQAHVGLAAR